MSPNVGEKKGRQVSNPKNYVSSLQQPFSSQQITPAKMQQQQLGEVFYGYRNSQVVQQNNSFVSRGNEVAPFNRSNRRLMSAQKKE